MIKDGVLVGGDGWLFLVEGSNEVLSYYTDPMFFDGEKVEGWVNLLGGRAGKFEKRDIPYFHFFVPDKITLYAEYIDMPLPVFEHHPIEQITTHLRGKPYWLDVTAAMSERKLTHSVYLRTDTHWSIQGCYCAYEEICRKLSVAPDVSILDRPHGTTTMALDLGGRLTPKILEEVSFYHILWKSKRVYVNRMIQYNEQFGLENGAPVFNGCHAIYRNDDPSADPRAVGLFGDSFCEFRPTQLTAMLAETFREVHFFWSPSIDFEYVLANRLDIVISEMAERFARLVPSDNGSLLSVADDRLDIFLKEKRHTSSDPPGNDVSALTESVRIVGEPWIESSYYDAVEPFTHGFWGRETVFRRMFDRLELDCVVDLACGHGRHSAEILHRVGHLTLVDIHEENLQFCRRRLGESDKISFIRGNGYSFEPIADDSITAIFCYDSMVHFSPDIVASYLDDSRRVLKPGGMALFHHSNWPASLDGHYGQNPHARNHMTQRLFADYAAAAKLDVLESRVIQWGEIANLDCVTLVRKRA